MLRKKNGLIEWLEFELFADIRGLKVAVFLRHGGVSLSPFSSLNVKVEGGDFSQNVAENRERIRAVLGLPALIAGRQCHGSYIELVPTVGASHLEEGCDGLMTTAKDLGLMIKHADCQAAIFFDPIHRAIGAI
ncbi:MAG: laccase domain-containing protein, partial [Anaerolineae bacterium]